MSSEAFDYLRGQYDAFSEMEYLANLKKELVAEKLEAQQATQEALLQSIREINSGLHGKLHNVHIYKGGR